MFEPRRGHDFFKEILAGLEGTEPRRGHHFMLKKILIFIIVSAALFSMALGIVARKAPGILIQSLEKALNKKVSIEYIEYHFPLSFEIQGLKVKDSGIFSGDNCFSAEEIHLSLSWLSLSQKSLIIDKMELDNAFVSVRQYHGKLLSIFSDALSNVNTVQGNKSQKPSAQAEARRELLNIHEIIFRKSAFQFIDYDVDSKGFVIALQNVEGGIQNVSLPFSGERMIFGIHARVAQGRDQRSADLSLNAWRDFRRGDSDTRLGIKGLYLPYFSIYTKKVTPAVIENGYADGQLRFHTVASDMEMAADVEMSGLLFGSYESNGELFGLNAERILLFLKDRNGKLKLPLSAAWNLDAKALKPEMAIRKGIERAMKASVFGSVDHILDKALKKGGDLDEESSESGGVEGTIKKIKDLLKY